MISCRNLCRSLLVGLAASVMAAGTAFAGDRDVFIFIGQSNMAGRTPFESSDHGVATNADLLNPDGGWTPASNLQTADLLYNLPTDYFGFNRYSNVAKSDKPQLYNPGLAFANKMATMLPNNKRLGLVFNARGATNVSEWQSTAAPLDTSWGTGNLFRRTIDRAMLAVGSGAAANEVKGLIVDLGASDALQKTTPADYLTGMKALVRDMRTYFPNVPVFIGQQPYMRPEDYTTYQLNPDEPRDLYRLNAALTQWAAADPTIHIVRSDGLGLLSHTRPDTSHFDHAGVDQMGARYARAIAQVVYGHTDQYTRAASSFSPNHTCKDGYNRAVCTLATRVKNPDWTLDQDVMVLPHRGYYGFGDALYTPENSLEGYANVKSHGYGMSELDFTTSKTHRLDNAEIPNAVMSHDYVVYRVADYPQNTDLTKKETLFSDLTLEKATSLNRRDRFGNVTTSRIASQDKARQTMLQNELLTVADIKQKSDNDPNQYATNWVKQLAGIMYDYSKDNRLFFLSVKTPYTPSFIIGKLPDDLKSKFDQVLWVPQVASSYTSTTPGMGDNTWIASSTDYMDVWQQQRSAILNFEINYRNTSDSRLQPFSLNGYDYVNMLDYAKSTMGYRGGTFSEEPISPRGNVNRNGLWVIKDANLDMRGDPLFEAFTPKWGNFIVPTTDRADIWEKMLCSFYGASC